MLTVVAAAFGSVALAYVPSRDVHDSILAGLRAIDLQYASLQRDVLQARAGLLRNYDPLVSGIADLNATTDRLRMLFTAGNHDGVSYFDDELSAVSGSIASDENLVDRFKTNNSLLQNSLEIFNQLLSQRYQDPYFEGQPPTDRSGHLGNLMMRFASNPSTDLKMQIRAELEGLQARSGSRQGYVRGLASHAVIILKTLPLVDQTTLAIQGSKTLHTADSLRRRYLSSYEAVVLQSTRYRVILGSVSFALFGFAATLVQRRREKTRKLTQQLRFESTLDEVRRLFGEEYTAMETAVENALELLGELFEGPKGDLIIINSENGEIEHSFGTTPNGELHSVVAAARGRPSEELGPSGARSLMSSDMIIAPRGKRVEVVVTVRLEAQSAVVLRLIVDRDLFDRSDEIHSVLEQAAGTLAHCVRLVQDREEREALQARLEHSQRLEAVGTLAGGIAHEFNNILLAMMGYSEMALDASPGESSAARYIQETIQSGRRAKLVIDQILAFSRKGERITKPFDLCEAVRDVLPLLTVSLPDHVALDVDLPRQYLTVTGNPIEVQQAIMNICRNAVQACRNAGSIKITLSAVELRIGARLSHGTAPPGGYAVLQITDTGDGIEANALPHIFEPFFTTRSDAGGTGLGLAAVHAAIVGMAGYINVQSCLGAGTRFDLYFPITHRPSVSIRDFMVDQSVPIGAGQTVLIAEADDVARIMYEEKAAALGYEPIGFSSLNDVDGWISKRGHAADLVALNIGLWPDQPDMSVIKQHFSPIPTLLIGASPTSTVVDKGSLNQVQYLREPVTPARLAWAISTALAKAGTSALARSLSPDLD